MKPGVGEFRSRQQPITHIAPTRPGMSWLAWLFLMVLRRISKLKMARGLEFIHFAQWQRVRTKKLPRLSPDQPAENFSHDFFMFTTNYNGDWDQYIDTFARVAHIRRGMWWLWRFSQGFPGPIPLRNFKQFIHYQTYSEALYYSAYPAATVRNIAAALEVKRELEAFSAVRPGEETPAAFKKRYLGMVTAIAPNLGSAPGPAPYVIATSQPGGLPAMVTYTRNGKRKRKLALGPLLGRLATGGGGEQTLIAAMSPIEVKPAHAVTKEIASRIAAVNASTSPSPFAMCPMLHMARLLIIDDLRPKLGSRPSASLRTNYLLFVAAIDGRLEDFLDCLYTADPDFAQGVWGRCLGYPEGRDGPVYLRRYIARSLLPVQLPFVGFPGHSALDIRRALRVHSNMLDWMGDVHRTDMSDAELMAAWQGQLAVLLAGDEATR
ncbi:MAG: hypothetical protein JO246_00830 [Frankiaceae bacterium]|nr:hypothetical protein [Frankiaceae bacterium]MBV9872210.1 hypothetical protein [Frankiaceae bacterium]